MMAIPGNVSSALRIPQEDIDFVVNSVGSSWSLLRSQRIFMTGGTGFVGKWLLATFLEANQRFSLCATVTLVSRNPEKFLTQFPQLKNFNEINWTEGDIRSFSPIGRQDCTYFIHAATDVACSSSPSEVFDACDLGTRNVLEVARQTKSKKRFLLLSSGAVYGNAAFDLVEVPEDFQGAPSTLNCQSAYGEGKRVSEFLCSLEAERDENFEFSIARCFSFVGPHLPLDKQFAIGNFIRSVLMDEDICINGDGTPLRSYLYTADMALWLWVMLFNAKNKKTYNVGGRKAVSIYDLAKLTKDVLKGSRRIEVLNEIDSTYPVQYYIPSLSRIIQDFNLNQHYDLADSIWRTAEWAKDNEMKSN